MFIINKIKQNNKYLIIYNIIILIYINYIYLPNTLVLYNKLIGFS